MVQESPIFVKTYDFLNWIIPVTTKFPREQRFVLAKAVQEVALAFQETLIEAGMSSGKGTNRALNRADMQLTKLRFYMRLCKDLRLLSLGQYRHVAEMLTEIGKLLGGWKRQFV